MDTVTRPRSPATLSAAEKQQREWALREAIASAEIEGGSITTGAEEIMRESALGLIDSETAIARIKALHGL